MLLATAGCGDAPASHSTVRLALTAEACSAYCVNAAGAELRTLDTGLPLGPPMEATCGGDIVFDGLPAGLQVTLGAWLSLDGDVKLRGESDTVTIPRDTIVDVSIALEAVAPPVLNAIVPDPVVLGAGATLEGAALGPAQGTFDADIDGAPIVVDTWSNDQLSVSLSADDQGETVGLTRCGVASNRLPWRLIDPAGFGETALSQPACAGQSRVSLSRLSPTAVALVTRCEDGDPGFVQRLDVDAGCLSTSAALRLDAAPTAAATDDAGRVWVALVDGTTVAVDLDGATTTHAIDASDDAVAALAVVGDEGFAVVGSPGRLARVDDDYPAVAGVSSGLDVRALAASTAGVFAVAEEDGEDAKLVFIGSGAPTEWRLLGCERPIAVASDRDGERAFISCDDDDGSHVLAFDVATTTPTPAPVDPAPTALSVEATGDVLWGASEQTLTGWAVGDATLAELVTWPDVTATPPVGLVSVARGLVTAGAGDDPLRRIAPYDREASCE